MVRDDTRKPVVVMLQGSGCAPTFVEIPNKGYENTSVYADLIESRRHQFHFMMVEKVGVGILRFPPGLTRDEMSRAFATPRCTPEYLDNARLEVRSRDVLDAITAVQREGWAGPVLLVGHSEGTHVVAYVAGRHPEVRLAAAGLLASAGPTPFFSGSIASGGSIEGLKSVLDTMQMLHAAPDDVIYRGHPARRWKTFWLDNTPLDSVRSSTVPLFVAQGSRDGTTVGSDLFVIESVRQHPTRPIRYVVVRDGNHVFELPSGESRLPQLFDDFLQWGLDDQRVTGVGELR